MSDKESLWAIRNMATGKVEYMTDTRRRAEVIATVYAQHYPSVEMWVYKREFVVVAKAPVEITEDGEKK